MRFAGRRRDLDGRRPADAGADEGRPKPYRVADRRRHRPAPIRRPGSDPGRRHRFRRGAGRALARGVSPGRPQPDHHQRAPDQPGLHSRPLQARGPQRLLFCASGRSRNRRAADHRIGEATHPLALPPRSRPLRSGAVPDEPRWRRSPLAEHRTSGGAEPRRRAQGRAFRLDLRPRRQDHADRERLRQRRLQRRHRLHRRCRSRRRRTHRQFRRPHCHLRLRRTRYAGAGLRRDDPQEPRLRIPCRRNPGFDSALRDAAAEPALHRRDPREATGRAGRPEEGSRDCCTQRLGAAAMGGNERMAGRHPTSVSFYPLARDEQCLPADPARSALSAEPMHGHGSSVSSSGDHSRGFTALRGLMLHHLNLLQMEKARHFAEEALRVAERLDDAARLVGGHMALGAALWWQGKLEPALTRFRRGLEMFDPNMLFPDWPGSHPGVQCQSYVMLISWMLGYPDRSLEELRAAVASAETLRHPPTLAQTLIQGAALIHIFRHELPAAAYYAGRALKICEENRIAQFHAQALCVNGWALRASGESEKGLAQIGQGLDSYGLGASQHMLLALQADAQLAIGKPEAALAAVAAGLEAVEKTGGAPLEAELYRLRGEALLAGAGTVSAAETAIEKAIAVARRQNAKSWELRAAMSIAR